MLNIIIIGAGKFGCHIASVLSQEKHNIILIDKNAQALEENAAGLDVALRQGSGMDWQLLYDLMESSPDLLMAFTGSDETNLATCAIAKHLHFPKTIARIKESSYLNNSLLDFTRIFAVDYFVAPEVLVANDLLKHVLHPGAISIENFAYGAMQTRTLLVPEEWRCEAPTLKEIRLPENIIVGLIRRYVANGDGSMRQNVIFPHGNDKILPGDEVTFIGQTEAIADIPQFFNIVEEEMESVVIAGGSLTAFHLARLLLERDIDVRIIEKDIAQCTWLAERLPHGIIIHHDATDLDFLIAERVGNADLFIAATNNDETNLLLALLSKKICCKKTFLILHNNQYISIANQLGFHHTVSPRISAINDILSQLLFGKVTSLISLYEDQAEIMEVNVSMNSKIVGIPLSELGPYLPPDLLIVMIQNRGRIMIAHGNRIISPGDTVIVVTDPRHIDELEKIF
jgi:trk system potassium uptake protein TrkA